MAWTRLCKMSELKEGEGKFVAVGERQVAVFLHEGKLHVVDDYCPHAGGSLSTGFIENGCVVCSWHYWAFDLTTGKLAPTGRAHVRIYPSRVSDDGQSVEADL